MKRMDVATSSGRYPIIVEPGLLSRGLGTFLKQQCAARRVLAICDEAIIESHGAAAVSSMQSSEIAVHVCPIKANESLKSLHTVESIYRAALDARLDRSSFFVAIGGGLTGDVAGFAAATFLRGVPIIQAPTTLLAMVDASIGGKTGVNFPLPGGELGKNMIGAFWQPAAVLADPQTLSTLSVRELRSGMAESIKHAVIGDAALFEMIEQHVDSLIDPMGCGSQPMVQLIHHSQRVKANIVEEDEREHGLRALLNLGHTFAHVIETVPELDLLHGESVAIGMIAASHVAVATGQFSQNDADRVYRLIERIGLPTRITVPLDAQRLVDQMRYDKKTVDDRLRLVLPRAIGKAEIAEHMTAKQVTDAWLHVGAASDANGR